MNATFTRRLMAWMLGAAAVAAADAAPLSVEFAFATQDDFNKWTVIDANADVSPNTWTYEVTKSAANYKEDRYYPADEWLISPAVTLEAGKAYEITFNVSKNNSISSDKQKFSFNVGTEPTVAGLGTVIKTFTDWSKTLFTDETGTFRPETAGEYHFALHLYTDKYKGGLYVKSLRVEEKVPLPAAVTNVKAVAAPLGEMKCQISWTWPSKDADGGDLVKLEGAKVYRGTTQSFTVSDSSLAGTATGGNPGTEGSFTDESITKAGAYYYKVVPFTSNGDSKVSPTSVKSDFVGKATSISGVKNLKATLIPATENTADIISLTWDAPEATEGYLDPKDVAYKIVRKSVVQSKETTLETEWKGELPYNDEVPANDKYSYKIYTVYNGSTSWSPVESSQVAVSGVLELPYSETFDTQNSVMFWTFFHGEGVTRDWSFSSPKKALSYWGAPADAWALTPKFSMKAGKAYRISFSARVSNANSPKTLSLYYGNKADIETLLPKEIVTETINSGLDRTVEVMIGVPEDGAYHVAFRCHGESNSNDLFVDNVKIEEVVVAPASVESVSAAVGEEGALEVKLSWKNPALTNAGTTLESLSSVIVTCGNDTVATVTDAVPGKESTVTIPVEEAGIYTYAITPVSGEISGKSVETTTEWVGQDTPVKPTAVSVSINQDGSRHIVITPAAEGAHKGWLGKVQFRITRNETLLADKWSETVYDDKETGLPLKIYKYAVMAVNNAGQSEAFETEGIVIGDAISLPYEPDFTDAEHFSLWTSGSETATSTAKWKHTGSTTSSKPNTLQSGSKNTWAFTPKLVMYPGSIELKTKLSCYNARNEEDVEIWLCRSTNFVTPEKVLKIADVHVADVNYPEDKTFTFEIPERSAETGYHKAVPCDEDSEDPYNHYYIGYKNGTGNMYVYLHSLNVSQTVTTGIEDVAANGEFGVFNGRLIVPQGAVVRIYDITGGFRTELTADYSLSVLERGLYVAVCRMADGSARTIKFAL